MERRIFQKSYAWEEKLISGLEPGDILVSRWERGKPYGVVTGPSATGKDIVHDQPKSADFTFVPMNPIEPDLHDSKGRPVYVETGKEGIYSVFAPHNKTTPVAVTREKKE